MSTISNDFQKIKSYQDLKPYLGQIVAVQGHYYFTKFDEAFSVSDSTAKFAHVSRQITDFFDGGDGYHLNTLYKTNAQTSACIVSVSTLEYRGLSVRKATTEELKLIKSAVASSSAAFSDLFCREAPEETAWILKHV